MLHICFLQHQHGLLLGSAFKEYVYSGLYSEFVFSHFSLIQISFQKYLFDPQWLNERRRAKNVFILDFTQNSYFLLSSLIQISFQKFCLINQYSIHYFNQSNNQWLIERRES